MTNKELVVLIAKNTGIPHIVVNKVIKSFKIVLMETLRDGDSVSLYQLGTFSTTLMKAVKKKALGKMMNIPAHMRIKFKPTPGTKSFVNRG